MNENLDDLRESLELEITQDDLDTFDFTRGGKYYTLTKSREVDSPKPGFEFLDKYVSFVKGKTTILGAETHIGKTTLVSNIAANLAFKQNKKVLMFVPESGVPDTVAHIACFLAGKREDELTDEDLKLNSPNLLLIEKGITILEVERQIGIHNNPDVVIIDHIHYLVKSADNITASISAAMRSLCEIAKKTQTHIIIVSHLTKPPIGRENEIPTIYRLKDSSGLYQDADIVMLLHRKRKNLELLQPNEDRFDMDGLIVIDKNRINGKTGVVKFYFDKERHTFLI